MKNKHLRLVSLLLCAIMVFTIAGFSVSGHAVEADEDSQSQSESAGETPVPSDPVVTNTPVTEPTPETPPTPDQGTCSHNWVTHSEIITNDCFYGTTWRAYDVCTICGARRDSAWRPETIIQKGDHTWVVTSTSQGTCSGKTVTYKTCSVCGAGTIEYSGGTTKNGDHEWGPWGEPVSSSCSGTVRERTCTLCHAVDQQITGSGSHAWVWKETPATCSAAGEKWQECTRCGAKQNEQATPLKAHQWEADDGNCATPIKCAVCGTVVKQAMTHNYSSTYSHDNTQHWRQCTNSGCTQRTDVGAHTGSTSNDCTRLSSCSVCGMAGGSSGMSHNFDGSGGYVISSTKGHQIRCGNPGCTQVSAERPHNSPGAVVKCGEEINCVCGYPLVRGNGSHNFGGWTATATGHSRTCKTCGYVESASHTSSGGKSGSCTESVTCSVCGYVLSRGNGSHSFGVWMSNGSTHYRNCTHPGCTAVESSSHVGGKATCTSAAVCSVCGASYGSKAANAHTGGTEVRNARPAEVGKAGYTGDTYCLGCGKLISAGTTIKALVEDHAHSFTGSWHSDSGSHWRQCSCGERSSEATHSFVNGKCTVCGAADPNYRVCSGSSHVGGTELKNVEAAEVGKPGYSGDLVCTSCGKVITRGHTIPALDKAHEHEFSVAWRTDGTSHWRDCSCGEITRKAAHTYSKGICTVCGAADPNATEEIHSHTFGALHSNGQYHWRECTICGFQAEKTAHVILNGSCMTCGYVMPAIEKVKDVKSQDWFYEPVRLVLEAGLLSGGKAAGSATDFKPEEKVVLSELVDAIYRLAGSPAASSETRFNDVSEDDYYASAVTWSTENNIVDIFGDSFEGDKVATLQEMVTFLWRFAQTAGWDVETTGEPEIDNPEEIDDYAFEAMAWAAETGLIDGIGENTQEALTPDGVVTRAEAAVILVNFMEMIETNGLPEIEAGVEELPA